ncbi:MAG: pitrilysin family protein [Patescibacteria group bacterium]
MNIYQESILPNGLKIITSENPNSEIAAISVWIKVGSRNEKEDEFGYAHILEHLLSKGTKKYPSAFELSAAKDRCGALSNAITGPERIYAFIQSAKNHSEKMFELLADMILNPLLDAEILENEKQVIIQELYRARENYSKLLWIESMSKVFEGHPLAHPVLGTEATIISATSEKLREFHRNFFRPDNAAVIVTGGLAHQAVVELVKKFFSNWGQEIVITGDSPLPQIKPGFIFEKSPTKQTYLAFNYSGRKITMEKSLAFNILENYLSYGQSAFLLQELRHKRGLVYHISASNILFRDANLFRLETSTTKPKESSAVILDIMDNFEKYFNEKIFHTLKEQTLSVFLREMSDSLKELNFLGNGWRLYERLISPSEIINKYSDVSYGDIAAIKNSHLSKNNLLVAAIGETSFELDLA